MNFETILGLLAAGLSTVSFVPQAVKCWQTRQTRDISLTTYLFLVLGNVVWLGYGASRGDFPIVVTNVIVGVTGLSIILLKWQNRRLARESI